MAGYRTEAVLRRDSMGVVYKATHLAMNRSVALRLLPRELAEDAVFRARFLREARIQAAIDHPHFVTIYEWGESEHGLFLAMRLVIGPTLKDVMVARELDAGRTLRILTQVADALDAAHSVGLIHGHLRPQSILVAARDHAYVTDFGLAGGPDRLGVSGAGRFVETIDYMSPEQIRGEQAVKESDSYALAAVLYECLSGVEPYPRESDVAVLFAHMSDPPPRLGEQRPDLPVGLDDVLTRGMAKKPAERFASATELLTDTNRAFTTRTRAAFPPAALEGLEATGVQPSDQQGRLLVLLRDGAREGILPESALGLRSPCGRREAESPAPVEAVDPAGRDPSAASPATRPQAPLRSPKAAPPWLPRLLGVVVALSALGAAIKWLVGCAVDVPARRDRTDTVDCTVFAPPDASTGEPFLVQVFAHLPLQAADARALAMEFDPDSTRRAFKSLESPILLGAKLGFHLSIPGARIDDSVQSLVWRGRAEAVQFAATVAEDIEQPRLIGTVTVTQDSIPIGHVKFMLRVRRDGATTAPLSRPVGDDARRYRSAFLSYASTDRDQVLRGAQMLRSVEIRCFQDILELDPGDRWERKLYSFIEQSDLFLLFWSNAAKESEWVRKEVGYALQCKGTDLDPPEIKPIILERPPSLPWPEVAHVHFDDRLSYFIGS